MSASPNQFRAGVFVALGLFTVVASIMLLGGNRSFFTSYNKYTTRLEQVQGINVGSVVSLAGLNVGNVEKLGFDGENRVTVFFNVTAKHAEKITTSSVIDVRTQGALGDKFLYITPGIPNEKSLPDGAEIQSAKGQDLIGALTEKGGEATKILRIMDEVLKLVQTINGQGRSEKVMANLLEASQHMKTLAMDMQQITQELKGDTPAEIRQAAKHMNSIMQKIDRGDGTLGALVNDKSLHEQLRSMVGASPRKQSMKKLIESSIEKGF